MNAMEIGATRDIAQRLAEAEATIEALLSGQIDAVVDSKSRTPVLLAKAQDALRESEERYRRIVETTNEGVWQIDADNKTTFMNRRMVEMLGCGADGGLGHSPFEFIDEGGRANLTSLMRKGVATQVEVRFTRTDGTSLWALLEATPVFDKAGRYDGSFAMAMEITGRKQAEAALRASEKDLLERMRIAALTADVGMVLTHEDTLERTLEQCAQAIVQHLDVAFATIWTLDPKHKVLELQATAGPLFPLDRPQGRVPVGQLRIGRIAEERRPYLTNDILRDSRPGDAVWDGITAFAGHPLLVNDQLVGVLAIFAREPISEPAFMGLGAISDALAVGIQRKFVTSTNAGLELQLRQAQKMEAVGRLTGGIAHDFNNILSIILTYGEFLLEDLKPMDPARADAEQICKAGQRAAALTRQLLMFSRQQVLEPKVLDLAALIVNMADMLRRVLGEDVELVLLNDERLGRVRVDPGSIEQVIMNLVVNARDAMPSGGHLTIETKSEVIDGTFVGQVGAKPGRYVVLSVTDTGTGMDPATEARIFEPFFTTKGVGKGTGLGLSTVFGIVQQSNGEVRVQSELGSGSTFTVYLPHVDAAAEALVIQPRAALRGTETILLVEDEDQVRAVARAILQRHGYRVIEMRTAEEALVYCQGRPEPIHLLLTDVVMPQMGGPELARDLILVRPELGVLFMSGYTDDSVVRHGVLEADIAFLQKPFTSESLTRKVREVLDTRRS